MRIFAFDPSLTGFGYAGPALHSVGVISPPKHADRGAARLVYLRDRILRLIDPLSPPDLVVIEGYSYASSATQAHKTGELGGVLRVALHESGVPYVEVSPKGRMKYATGKGMAKKEAVLAEAIRRLGYEGGSFDEADAMVLLAMAFDAYGQPSRVEMPKVHREALTSVPWPKVGRWAPVVEFVPKEKRRRKAVAC